MKHRHRHSINKIMKKNRELLSQNLSLEKQRQWDKKKKGYGCFTSGATIGLILAYFIYLHFFQC